MDILIKNMEMPNGCYDCPLRKHEERSYYYECNASDGVNLDWYTIPAYCPLVALPEHGRLCDLDSLIEHETYNIEQALFDSDEVLEDLKNAPVIVEASNE